MGFGEASSPRWASVGLGLVLGLISGCALNRPPLDRAVQADQGASVRNRGVPQAYAVACPDILEVQIAGVPAASGRYPVAPDGRIDLGPIGPVRVEELGVDDIVVRIAAAARVPVRDVHVRLAVYKSQQIYVFGQVFGQERAVPYQGPETVLDLLQRLGGIRPGVAAEDVAVVRSRIAEGGPPQVFRIDLPAIVSGKDRSTNIRLQPSDEVYVGESRRSIVANSVPPCLKPIYDVVSGLYRSQPAAGSPKP